MEKNESKLSTGRYIRPITRAFRIFPARVVCTSSTIESFGSVTEMNSESWEEF